MWGYVVSLFLVILYPGSLLLPAIFGFLVQLSTALFGTLVGDWVDANPRMKGEELTESSLDSRTGEVHPGYFVY